MPTTYQVLRIFTSSPGDVDEERECVEPVIRRVNQVCREKLGIVLEDTSWRTLPPIMPAGEQPIQDLLQKRVGECDIFVLILNRRYGTSGSPGSMSRTEQEVRLALDRLRNGTGPIFFAYFRALPPNTPAGVREPGVEALLSMLGRQGLLQSYANAKAFREILTHHLYDAVLGYRFSTAKYRALKAFWQFGTAEQPTHPRLAIVYPPIDVSYMRTDDPETFWMSRLMPNLVFEDFKALQKIDKTLRQIGFNDFTIYSTTGLPPHLQHMNRVWLCLPRSRRARDQLRSYGARSRVRFGERRLNDEARIYWKAETGDEIEIRSPLSKYVGRQRRGMGGGEWDAAKGRIIAKDFAVLARFIDHTRSVTVRDNPLVDYFAAGIRGLGTWGAAWFIDREYETFLRYHPDQDIQLLLEVTYRDERIFEVKDVSNEPASYFHAANSDDEVTSVIEGYERSS